MAEGPGWQTGPNVSSDRRRWSHLFHQNIYDTVGMKLIYLVWLSLVNLSFPTEHKEYAYAPNWQSISEPASLPITTDYRPSQPVLYVGFLFSLFCW